ncbi:ABC transporter ATP-binding protein [Bradyrhizobium sp. U87765 SZCCT0131]|nr:MULTISPECIES: ABC transporter ATP-binding protein [unclassified Bradyrhizobium]MBR1217736.1 ABC transporter ATP-binding protein [Bradyrhizobium sp. U87765 SZCCT0131]MBR1261318.1 ABC transporter ATP-binding protein [Bradyrhizobium sp. U87765 SZCCT0134]MBR1303234.1 ABC transporter ATP-binding protein [Bradyrhizobium sp. U87765 SZCCT0110]MBR1318840.1 ABC transporter ATP-binding protein [Bradyrhizobium sp. U87765 SZCCT0109]MBR1347165.1 ABC transporter ATP-binding protein [Bradyrhizobium sp. U87
MRDVVAGYGGQPILHGVSLAVGTGETLVVVGPNGSGKSTLMKTAVGLLSPFSGHILLGDADVTGLGAPGRAARGLAYVPQEANVFRNMTVLENLTVGYEFTADRARAAFADRLDAVLDLFPEIRARLRHMAGHLSGGQRQMVAMAAALMPQPSVLALDEPSAGLSPRNAESLFAIIGRIAASGVTLLIIEQNTRLGLGAADRGIVLVSGRIRLDAPAADLLANPDIRHLYLGGA